MDLLETILKHSDIKEYLSQYDPSEWERTIVSVLQYGIHSLKGLKHFKSKADSSKHNGKERPALNTKAPPREHTSTTRHQRPRTSAKNYPCKDKHSNLPRKCHGKENLTPRRSKREFLQEVDRSLVVTPACMEDLNDKSFQDLNDAFKNVPRILQPVELPLNNLSSLL